MPTAPENLPRAEGSITLRGNAIWSLFMALGAKGSMMDGVTSFRLSPSDPIPFFNLTLRQLLTEPITVRAESGGRDFTVSFDFKTYEDPVLDNRRPFNPDNLVGTVVLAPKKKKGKGKK